MQTCHPCTPSAGELVSIKHKLEAIEKPTVLEKKKLRAVTTQLDKLHSTKILDAKD